MNRACKGDTRARNRRSFSTRSPATRARSESKCLPVLLLLGRRDLPHRFGIRMLLVHAPTRSAALDAFHPRAGRA